MVTKYNPCMVCGSPCRGMLCWNCYAKANNKTTAPDLSGTRHGSLTVVERVEKKNGQVLWRCKCDCGGEVVTRRANLHDRRDCGCGRQAWRRPAPQWSRARRLSALRIAYACRVTGERRDALLLASGWAVGGQEVAA